MAEAAEPGKTVLICDDDELVARLSRQVLGRAGYRVLVAGSGDEALALSEGHEGEIALVLVDVVLPGLNGPELAEQMRAARPGLAVIYVSGYGAAAEVALGHRDRRAFFLAKPFTPDQLLESVSRALDEA